MRKVFQSIARSLLLSTLANVRTYMCTYVAVTYVAVTYVAVTLWNVDQCCCFWHGFLSCGFLAYWFLASNLSFIWHKDSVRF